MRKLEYAYIAAHSAWEIEMRLAAAIERPGDLLQIFDKVN